jgi:hypothetical protein
MSARALTPALVSIVLLAAWVGAAVVVAAVVAPAAFAVLPTRSLAGALVGRVLPVLFWAGIVIGLVVAWLGWRLPLPQWRVGAAFVLVASSAVAQFVIGPRIDRLRDAVGGPIDALDPASPIRRAFGLLHGLSVACLGAGGLAALVALILLVRLTTRSHP